MHHFGDLFICPGAGPTTLLEDSVADSKNLTGVRVMVIDDSNTIRRSAEIFLMQAGCQVILADNGFDAPWPLPCCLRRARR